ncbi:MAG: phospholipase D-like domain-containing protein [Marmoricola sp.]
MSRRARRLPRAPRRARSAGARAALLAALAAALALSGLVVATPASAATRQAVTRAAPLVDARHPGRHHTAQRPTPKQKPRPKRKPKPKPVWSPTDGTVFNYPFSPRARDRFRIRRHVLAAVEFSPPGARIRLATFTFVDEKLTRALIAAHRRGVSTQVLVNGRDVRLSPPFHHLRTALGHSLHGRPRTSPELASFARTCTFSCRGTRGNLHSKIFLFSQVGRTRWVSMVGSPNLTQFAAEGQWNHLDTITGRATYRRLRRVFDQMRRDRPLRHPFERFRTSKAVGWVFPRPFTTPLNDPMLGILGKIGCRATPRTGVAVQPRPGRKHRKHRTGPTSARAAAKHPAPGKPRHTVVRQPVTRRTVIRIAMYAWFDVRGNTLARAVRQKWNQGCDVRILYSVLNGKVKRILYNPSGRGPIPMRRVGVPGALGDVVDYNHSKYLAVNGSYAGAGRQLVWTGSMNFTQLGLTSDDIIVRLDSRTVYRAYLRNFRRVWHGPDVAVPLPVRS